MDLEISRIIIIFSFWKEIVFLRISLCGKAKIKKSIVIRIKRIIHSHTCSLLIERFFLRMLFGILYPYFSLKKTIQIIKVIGIKMSMNGYWSESIL